MHLSYFFSRNFHYFSLQICTLCWIRLSVNFMFLLNIMLIQRLFNCIAYRCCVRWSILLLCQFLIGFLFKTLVKLLTNGNGMRRKKLFKCNIGIVRAIISIHFKIVSKPLQIPLNIRTTYWKNRRNASGILFLSFFLHSVFLSLPFHAQLAFYRHIVSDTWARLRFKGTRERRVKEWEK